MTSIISRHATPTKITNILLSVIRLMHKKIEMVAHHFEEKS